jgi:hypothetical protein
VALSVHHDEWSIGLNILERIVSILYRYPTYELQFSGGVLDLFKGAMCNIYNFFCVKIQKVPVLFSGAI